MSPGALVHSLSEILNGFVEYYRHLYLSHTTTTHQEAAEFLSTITLPTLTEEQRTSLDQPITLDAIGSLKNGKSPGPESLPGEFNKKLAGILSPCFYATHMRAKELGILPPSAYEANIIVIPNPGKDPKFCDSALYRFYRLMLKFLPKYWLIVLN